MYWDWGTRPPTANNWAILFRLMFSPCTKKILSAELNRWLPPLYLQEIPLLLNCGSAARKYPIIYRSFLSSLSISFIQHRQVTLRYHSMPGPKKKKKNFFFSRYCCVWFSKEMIQIFVTTKAVPSRWSLCHISKTKKQRARGPPFECWWNEKYNTFFFSHKIWNSQWSVERRVGAREFFQEQ